MPAHDCVLLDREFDGVEITQRDLHVQQSTYSHWEHRCHFQQLLYRPKYQTDGSKRQESHLREHSLPSVHEQSQFSLLALTYEVEQLQYQYFRRDCEYRKPDHLAKAHDESQQSLVYRHMDRRKSVPDVALQVAW